MAENDTPVSRRFTALTNRHMMAFYAVRKLAERNRDAANHAVEAARAGVREWSDVGREWAKRPGDLTGLLDGATQAVVNGQARSLDIIRKWWDGVRALRP